MEIHPAEMFHLRYQEGMPRLPLPLFTEGIAAGFPSPADDYLETQLDLNDLCIQHPHATFFARANGLSMINAGIMPGDVLVIDRAVEPQEGSIIVALVEGGFTVKRLHKGKNHRIVLEPENEDYPPIEITDLANFEIWGVVVSTVRVLGRSNLAPRIARHLK